MDGKAKSMFCRGCGYQLDGLTEPRWTVDGSLRESGVVARKRCVRGICYRRRGLKGLAVDGKTKNSFARRWRAGMGRLGRSRYGGKVNWHVAGTARCGCWRYDRGRRETREADGFCTTVFFLYGIFLPSELWMVAYANQELLHARDVYVASDFVAGMARCGCGR